MSTTLIIVDDHGKPHVIPQFTLLEALTKFDLFVRCGHREVLLQIGEARTRFTVMRSQGKRIRVGLFA